jgi:hypothetical protein
MDLPSWKEVQATALPASIRRRMGRMIGSLRPDVKFPQFYG